MKILNFQILLFSIIALISCKSQKITSTTSNSQTELEELVNLMSGEFSSSEQAKQDSLFYNINLVMYPIWEKDKSAKWLYVEQAVTSMLEKPYRQRVYKISQDNKGIFESKVFELPEPKRFIHGWNNEQIFNQINSDSLILRPGCAVYLKKINNNCYSGSTNHKDCKSTLRGASYATSTVEICKDVVTSWDQGWNSADEQVWGAETKGYIFKRKK